MSFNFMNSLNLFDMYVQTNLYLFYCFNLFVNSDSLVSLS